MNRKDAHLYETMERIFIDAQRHLDASMYPDNA